MPTQFAIIFPRIAHPLHQTFLMNPFYAAHANAWMIQNLIWLAFTSAHSTNILYVIIHFFFHFTFLSKISWSFSANFLRNKIEFLPPERNQHKLRVNFAFTISFDFAHDKSNKKKIAEDNLLVRIYLKAKNVLFISKFV